MCCRIVNNALFLIIITIILIQTQKLDGSIMTGGVNDTDFEEGLLKSYWQQVEYATKNFYNCTMISQMFGSYFTGETGNLIGYIAMIPAIYFAKPKSKDSASGMDDDELDDSAAGDTVAYLTSIVQELSFLTKLFERVFRIGNKWHEVNGFAHRIVELEKGLKNTIEKKLNRKKTIVSDKSGKKKFDFNPNSCISLDNVTIATPAPNTDVLIRNLTIIVDKGCHIFTEGPDGVGKRSLFSIIGGLWQPYNQGFEPIYFVNLIMEQR